jgi:site-specific recombinase XerD
MDQFREWSERQQDPVGFNKAAVQRWRADLEAQGLSAATVSLRMSAVRRLALEASDNGLLDRDTAAAIGRAKGPRPGGIRSGRRLALAEAENLLSAPDAAKLKGKRDRALLSALVGCGLRRKEAVGLGLDRIQQRDGRWVIPDLLGKGGRVRISVYLKTYLFRLRLGSASCAAICGHSCRLARNPWHGKIAACISRNMYSVSRQRLRR